MDFTSNYHQTYLKEIRYSESIVGASRFQSPYFVFELEALIKYTEELVIPILLLKELGITNEKIKENFFKTFSVGISNIEYPIERFIEVIIRLYDDMIQAREIYASVCIRNNLENRLPKLNLKDPRKLSFADLIKQGQKSFNKKYKKLTSDEMGWSELLLHIMKSIWVNLVELRNLGFDDEEAYINLASIFGWRQRFKQKNKSLTKKVLPELIQRLVETDTRLIRRLYEAKKEKYGEMELTEVSTSVRVNKAILVSGHDFGELEMLLKATKDKGIDIYTHGYMLSAHAYPKFKTYPNLVGHFGEGVENYLLNFSEFPGAIFLTRFSLISLESFYRGRIYTTDVVALPGVILIKNNDFTPLIESALHSEGFTEIIKKPPIKLNFSEKNIMEKLCPIILFTKCGEHMLSNAVYLKKIGVRKVYFADCASNLFNPALIDSTRKIFDIKNYTNPENDLKDILQTN